MKCVICHSSNVEDRVFEEAVWAGDDVALVPCRVLVCNDCGERYYSRQTMRRLEDIEASVRARTLTLKPVGQVLRLPAQQEPTLALRESQTDYDATSSEAGNSESPDAQSKPAADH